MESSFALPLLRKEFSELCQSEDTGFSVGLDNDNFFTWQICFQGTPDTLYEGGFFIAHMIFPEDYPNNPPEMRFKTEMWHPNIYPDGKVCISILHAPGVDAMNEQESAEERWRPILGVEAILVSVLSMLNDPNIESPANLDAGIMFRDNRTEYNRIVRRLAQKSVDSL